MFDIWLKELNIVLPQSFIRWCCRCSTSTTWGSSGSTSSSSSPPTASSPAGATSTSSTSWWPSPGRSRSSSTSSRWSGTTWGQPLLTRPLETCHPSMRRFRQLQLRWLLDWKWCTSSTHNSTFSTFRWAKKRPLHRSTTSPWQWGRTLQAPTRTWPAPTQARPPPPLLCLCLLLLSSKRLLSVIYLMQEKYIHIHPVLFILGNFTIQLVAGWDQLA